MNEPLNRNLFKAHGGLNQRGSTLLTALIMSVVVTIIIMASAVFLNSRSQVVMLSSTRVEHRIAVDGLLAYTINGIKQSWCFSSSWAQTMNCGLTDSGNVARLLLSDESLRYIGDSETPHPEPLISTKLSSITRTVNFSNITTTHALYNIAFPLRKHYSEVRFTIKRDDSAVATTKGQEVRLRILISVIPDSTDYQRIDLDSQVIVYPRELSYFTLIMPRDLHLGNLSPIEGDNSFSNVVIGEGRGLRFESPVFVNGNLHMPNASLQTPMNNVVFLDKVVLGGNIMRDTKLFSPMSAGGQYQMYNNEMRGFAGLLGGYELDPEKDIGLDYLYELDVNSPPPENINLCVSRLQAAYDLTITKDTELYTRLNSVEINAFKVSASLGPISNFVEQNLESGGAGSASRVTSSIPSVTDAGSISSWNSGAVFRAKLIYEGLNVGGNRETPHFSEFYIPRSGIVTVKPVGESAGSPQIRIVAAPHRYGGNDQYNQVNMDITFINSNALDIGPYKVGSVIKQGGIRLVLEAFDYGYVYGKNVRDATSYNATLGPYKTNGFTFRKDGTEIEIVNTMTDWSLSQTLDATYTALDPLQVPNSDVDYARIDESCMSSPDIGAGAMLASFPAAAWGTSFAKEARHAWRFKDDASWTSGYWPGSLSLGAATASYTGAAPWPTFETNSLVNQCIITSAANFVAGFYNCETLTIQARSTPLRIIGTFIVKTLNIDPSAYQAGIRWSNIYHPQAVYELRAANILGRLRGDGSTGPQFVDCDDTTIPPLWSPGIGASSAVKHYICNPVSLRTANPFKWTTVDPDCGSDPNNSYKIACKYQPRRFLVKEISRTKGM